MKILHIAPMNTAGVPIEFVRAERAMGIESRLITLSRSRLDYEEDICLELPLFDHWLIRLGKKLFSPKKRTAVNFQIDRPREIPPVWIPNRMEHLLINLRERLWKSRIYSAIQKYKLLDFDVYQLDGGLGFFRDSSILQMLKARGKKIICCYTGSDLRVRGIVPAIDQISDLNISVEFDHQYLHPNLTHVPFPIDSERFSIQPKRKQDKLIISHAPTNRQAKGSDIIIPIVQQLEQEYPVELKLIENLPYAEALKQKAQSDIFIDQIGDLGYGISGLEALCMGIVTCSCVAPGFAEKYPDHPFIEISFGNLRAQLIHLIEDTEFRMQQAKAGHAWVKRIHSSQAVVRRIHQLAEIN